MWTRPQLVPPPTGHCQIGPVLEQSILQVAQLVTYLLKQRRVGPAQQRGTSLLILSLISSATPSYTCSVLQILKNVTTGPQY